jgi:16S rRNA processing protein RimM
VDEAGQELGVLSDVLQHGTVDTWVFSGPRPFMAPALRQVFPEVDPEEKRIRVVREKLEEVAVFED